MVRWSIGLIFVVCMIPQTISRTDACRVQTPDIPQAGRYGRRGRAGTGSTGRRRDCLRRRKQPLLPSRRWKITFWVCLWKHEQRKPYVNRWRNKTRGWQPVYPRFIRGTTSALRSWLLTKVPTPICPCKPFSCKACLIFLKLIWEAKGAVCLSLNNLIV